MRLPSIVCPECLQAIESDEFEPALNKTGATKASTYETCKRRCEACGFGFSNANHEDVSRLTIILREPFVGVPSAVCDGWHDVVPQAINRLNRASKKARFASRNSEDHVTWTLFRHLQLSGSIAKALSGFLEGAPSCVNIPEPTMLLWGAPVPSDDAAGAGLVNRLKDVCRAIPEEAARFSEPDVILDFGDLGLVFIEVKLHSPNDRKPPDYSGWSKYLRGTSAFSDPQSVAATGLYELTRNWRLAWDLSDGRPIWLINLGPDELTSGDYGALLRLWSECLAKDQRHRFVSLTWTQLLASIPSRPEWLDAYLTSRRVC